MTHDEIADKLTRYEKELLVGESEGWGSWMFEAGSYLCSLGLGTKRNGSIAFDTPLAKEMREHLLRARSTKSGGEG